ncbi:MAG: hypothetical protein KC910_01860 [Candidatus Eremiobacteraeota bacterium]|nr:hypothetical protein [Candidatus Eremiobacteraeota bacterium]
MSVDQVAAQLKVEPEHVRRWIKSGQLRSSANGIRPYDLNKFKLDCENEIDEARRRPPAPPPTIAKPEKTGFFERLRRFLPGGRRTNGEQSPRIVKVGKAGNEREVQKLKTKLKAANDRIRSLEKQSRDEGESPDQSRRLKELEAVAARLPELEARLRASGEAEDRVQMLEIQLAQSEGLLRDANARISQLESDGPSPVVAHHDDGSHEKIQALEAEIASLERQLAERPATVASPGVDDERVAALEERLADYAESLAARERQVQELQAQMLAMDGGSEGDHVAELRQALTEAQDYNERAFQKFQESEARRLELTRRAEALEKALVEARRASEPALGEAEFEALKADYHQWVDAYHELESQAQAINEELNEARRENAGIRSFAEAQAARAQALEEQLQQLQGQSDSGAQVESLLKELQLRDQLIAHLEGQLADAQQGSHDGQALAEAQQAAQTQVTDLERRIEDLNASHRVELNSLKRSNEVVRLANQRLESELAEMRGGQGKFLPIPNKGANDQNLTPQLQAAESKIRDLEQLRQRLEEELRSSREEMRLQKARAATSNESIASQQIAHLQRTVASRDAQVKKLAAKLADMERGIGKAHEESTRLTELLIDRENKLKNVRVAFEKDYEERFKSMERQITGLEWKLSLRDDRIGALEQELGHTTGKVLPPPTPRQPEV